MYIKISFKDLESEETIHTQYEFLGSPNGMCLTSSNAARISSKEMLEKVGISVIFWYLDDDVLNNKYFGVEASLNHIRSYPGVDSVDVLPFEDGDVNKLSNEAYNALLARCMTYL